MFRMYFLLQLLYMTGRATFMYYYYTEELFDDLLCLSSATKFTGVHALVSSCAVRCKRADECSSFFYSSKDKDCFCVGKVLTSRSGCENRPGMSYYITQAESDCYNYTVYDYGQMSTVTESDQCESFHFHRYTVGNNQMYKGCGDCYCCQWKGCYEGSSRNYNGTWSQTKYGRRCQRWGSQSPHGHIRDSPSVFPEDASVYDAHNYCRDPDYEGSPWCYTEDSSVRWEFCDIPKC